MKKIYVITSILVILLFLQTGESVDFKKKIETPHDVQKLFPHNPQEITTLITNLKKTVHEQIAVISKVPDSERTFINTARALDALEAQLMRVSSAIQVLEMVSPDEKIRASAHAAIVDLNSFTLDTLAYNPILYRAFKTYALNNAPQEKLNCEQQYYLQEQLKNFEKLGLGLPSETQEKLKAIQKEISELCLTFETNIASDAQELIVSIHDLAGLSTEFLAAHLIKDSDTYTLRPDYPTLERVMQDCTVESTRKSLWNVFNNRAHPINTLLLARIVALRHELALLLGYTSYAHLNIDDQMASTPEHVAEFLADISKRSDTKANQEYALLTSQLPSNITLTAEGTFKPWDFGYIKAEYKRKFLTVDERLIAEYFPLEKTIQELLDVYTQFLGIKFLPITTSTHAFWHQDVKLIAAHVDEKLLGYLLLDLHPRPFKYSHACHCSIVPAQKINSELLPAVSVVIANFPQATTTQPALLSRNDVTTFFHEFGHALHGLFGATEMASFAGTSVKRDFVEMPSQMLEEWMFDAEILRKISSHYKTGLPLPDETIQRIRALKDFDTADLIKRQLCFAKLSLNLFGPEQNKNAYTYKQAICAKVRPMIALDPDDHFEASFGHLTGYGAQYYGYLWSKVYALDLFEHIKQFGLLNPEIGKRYAQEVIGRGGSCHPKELLTNFLGREPRTDAFFMQF